MVQQSSKPASSAPAAGLDAAAIRAWIVGAADLLSQHAELLNGLNVFPVADADTGSNMAASLRGAAAAVGEAPGNSTAQDLLAVAARGALRAARGNSGVILSEWLRGFAQSYGRSADLSDALVKASVSATEAVAKPAPGTILTAAQAASRAAQELDDKGASDGLEVLVGALGAARTAAQHSPESLATLARNGVVDAGACGLVFVLGALQAVFTGNEVAAVGLGFDPFEVAAEVTASASSLMHDAEQDDADEDGFEVMFTLTRPARAKEFAPGQLATELRRQLSEIGNSVVVVGGLAVGDKDSDSEWHAHVHVADVGAAMELIDHWRQRGVVGAIQIRHLAIPAGELNAWVTTNDLDMIAEFARGGAVVLVPGSGSEAATEIAEAVKASPTTANIVLVEPNQVDAVSSQLNYPTDLILGPENPAAEALILMVIGDQISAGNELVAARETAERLITSSTSICPCGLPAQIHDAAVSGLVVAAVPHNEPPMELEAARQECENLGAELVVIHRADNNPVIHWATEGPDGG